MSMEAYAPLDLTGRAILVIGATSTMGRPVATLCAKRGARLVFFSDDEAALSDVVDEAKGLGAEVHGIVGDVTKEAEVQGAVQDIVTRYGRLDGAFNAAVAVPPTRPLAEVPVEEFNRVQEVNVTGVFLSLKHEITQMLTQSTGGSIVNLGSLVSMKAMPDMPTYTTSKHGVMGLTRSASTDYSRHGIRVNAVLPGLLTHAGSAAMLEDPATRQYQEQLHPIGRFGELSEMAEVVTWLLSDAASFVTGAPFLVDGGASAV